jgi:hypothetical protein
MFGCIAPVFKLPVYPQNYSIKVAAGIVPDAGTELLSQKLAV